MTARGRISISIVCWLFHELRAHTTATYIAPPFRAGKLFQKRRLSSGKEFLDRQVSQVVATLYGGQRAGTLALIRADALGNQDLLPLHGMSGLILIRPVLAVRAVASKGTGLKSQVLPDVDLELEPIVRLCSEASTPLIILPCLSDIPTYIEEVRAAYLGEVKKANARLHAHFIRLVIEHGLVGFVEQLAGELSRPWLLKQLTLRLLQPKHGRHR